MPQIGIRVTQFQILRAFPVPTPCLHYTGTPGGKGALGLGGYDVREGRGFVGCPLRRSGFPSITARTSSTSSVSYLSSAWANCLCYDSDCRAFRIGLTRACSYDSCINYTQITQSHIYTGAFSFNWPISPEKWNFDHKNLVYNVAK